MKRKRKEEMGLMVMRIPLKLKEEIFKIAEKEKRSGAGQIELFLEKQLKVYNALSKDKA